MRTTSLTMLFWALALWLPAQATLTVINPDRQWQIEQGSIEEATVTIAPKGIYLDVSLYLTLSYEETNFGYYDSLETTLNFTLPEEAAIYDSWLWINEVIVKADILDRRTATNIYEEIVDRQQDPSILFKMGAGRYQLRVYPFTQEQRRQVKISYLLPADWTAEQVLADLPMEILAASYIPLQELTVRVWAGAEWGQPRIPEYPELEFYSGVHPELGAFSEAVLSEAEIKPGLTLALDAPLNDGLYVNHNPGLQIYQAVALPDQLVELPDAPARSLMIYLDYKPENAIGFNQEILLEGLRLELLAHLRDQDSFQLFTTTNGAPTGLTTDWAAGSDEAIAQVFNNIDPQDFPENGNLSNALFHALDLAESQDEEVDVLLISNSQNEGDPWYVDQSIDELRGHNGFGKVNFHAIDYANKNIAQWWDWWGPFEWVGNDFLYSELALLSGGTFRRAGQFRYKIRKALETADRLRGAVELHTTLENGICYNRFLLGGSSVNVPLERPLYQVGRYQGSMPFQLEYISIWEGMPSFSAQTVDQANTYTIDTLAEEAWAANYLLSLENSNQGDATAQEIVESSIYYRVLSQHTAFLCLEPSLGGEPCVDCIDGSFVEVPIVGTEEAVAQGQFIRLEALPNPFAERVQIQAELLRGSVAATYQFAIYDQLGRLVKLLQPQTLRPGQEITLQWDGDGADGRELPAGLYFLIVQGPQGSAQLKLMKIGA